MSAAQMPLVDLSDFTPTPDLATAQTMPARWYTDPALLELEKTNIFWKTWQPVGRLELVQRPGDFFAWQGQPQKFAVHVSRLDI
jgi:hypothetical protein